MLFRTFLNNVRKMSDELRESIHGTNSKYFVVIFAVESSGEIDEAAKEWEHAVVQRNMDKELSELNKRLEQKEVSFTAQSSLLLIKDCYKCIRILLTGSNMNNQCVNVTKNILMQLEMKLIGGPDTEALKQHFQKKIMELEEEKRIVQVRLNMTIELVLFSTFYMKADIE